MYKRITHTIVNIFRVSYATRFKYRTDYQPIENDRTVRGKRSFFPKTGLTGVSGRRPSGFSTRRRADRDALEFVLGPVGSYAVRICVSAVRFKTRNNADEDVARIMIDRTVRLSVVLCFCVLS